MWRQHGEYCRDAVSNKPENDKIKKRHSIYTLMIKEYENKQIIVSRLVIKKLCLYKDIFLAVLQ